MNTLKSISGFCVLLLLLCQPRTGIAQEQRQHDAHVHGIGQLHIAIDGQTLSIELETPAANVVGFEQAPKTAEEKDQVQKVADRLSRGADLFVPTAEAHCRLVEGKVVSEQLEEKGHDHGHDGDGRHSEFHVVYSFQCTDPAALTHLDVLIFRLFPGTERLETRFVSSKGQGLAHLTEEAFRVTF
ncbi:MAG: DUF2796 domain-containing protein [Magnetococcales bacterium]|nr:DUF2796 domain-containing protein [Magnetococcales bacterium]